MRSEALHAAYGRAHGHTRARLPWQVVEDVDEGAAVAGLKARPARSAEELRALFNVGRANRDTQVRR